MSDPRPCLSPDLEILLPAAWAVGWSERQPQRATDQDVECPIPGLWNETERAAILTSRVSVKAPDTILDFYPRLRLCAFHSRGP